MAWGRRRPQPGLALGEHSRGWRTVVVVDGGSGSGVAVVVVWWEGPTDGVEPSFPIWPHAGRNVPRSQTHALLG